jgi:hypothetical protein
LGEDKADGFKILGLVVVNQRHGGDLWAILANAPSEGALGGLNAWMG